MKGDQWMHGMYEISVKVYGMLLKVVSSKV